MVKKFSTDMWKNAYGLLVLSSEYTTDFSRNCRMTALLISVHRTAILSGRWPCEGRHSQRLYLCSSSHPIAIISESVKAALVLNRQRPVLTQPYCQLRIIMPSRAFNGTQIQNSDSLSNKFLYHYPVFVTSNFTNCCIVLKIPQTNN
jgi:hypothetical protein